MTEIIARREFSPLYCFRYRVSRALRLSSFAKEKIHDVSRRISRGNIIYGGGLRYFPPCVPFQKHFGRVQLVLGSSLDVDELRFYEFHVDMALDIEGQAPV